MCIIHPSPGSLQYSKEWGGERIYTHYVQFLLYCTARTTQMAVYHSCYCLQSLFLLLCKNQFFCSPKTSQQSVQFLLYCTARTTQMAVYHLCYCLQSLLLLLRKNQFFSSPKTSQQSVRKPNRPSYSILLAKTNI